MFAFLARSVLAAVAGNSPVDAGKCAVADDLPARAAGGLALHSRDMSNLLRAALGLLLLALVATVAYAAGRQRTSAAAAPPATLPTDIDPGSRNRLPVVTRSALDATGQALYDKNADDVRTGRSLAGFQGPNGIVLYSPPLAEHDLKKNDYLRFDSRLGRRVYEICVLITARELDHQFEWAAHEPAALKAGVEPAVVEVIKRRLPVTTLPRKDAVLIELGREIFAHRPASSAVFAEALQAYGPQALVEAVSTMGHYANIALLLNAFDQQLAPGQRPLLPVAAVR